MELNINDLNKNSLIMKWNVDANNNPAAVYITNEVQQVSTTHNIIQLAQVPDEYMKMRIVSETDELVEVFNRREIAPTTYYVDYGCGLVYFHESLAGQLVKADYYGRGIILLSDKRVFHTVGGDFAYTLDELISKVWSVHPHFETFDNSTNFEQKMNRLLNSVLNFLENKYNDKTPTF